MHDASLQPILLRTLSRWRCIPLGDLLSMLPVEQRLRFRKQALEDLEMNGLITMQPAGDEPVVAITSAGARWLSERDGH